MKQRQRHGALPALVGLAVLLAGSTIPLRAEDESLWKETSRDVYLDGRLDPSVIVLRLPDTPRLAVLRDRADVMPLSIDTESLRLGRIAIADLKFGERGWEATTKGKPAPLSSRRPWPLRGGPPSAPRSPTLLQLDRH